MKDIDFEAINELILKQEDLLQFEHFNNQDAWELGKLMVEEISASGVDLAVCIRKLNESLIFQYVTEKTTIDNQIWMLRKFNTVSLTERSSLGATVMGYVINEDMTKHGFPEKEYALCGGGFPIKIKGSGIIGAIVASNLPHIQDHNFIVRCLSKYLGVDTPEIDVEF